VAVARRQPLNYTRVDVGKFLVFGLVTALHFLTFVAAVGFTSLAHALTLTYTAPVFVTLFSSLFLKEHIHRANTWALRSPSLASPSWSASSRF